MAENTSSRADPRRALAAGARLGPYDIIAPLGAGGMGEVYRARDRKLDRDVAIKVLPAHLSTSPEALGRFEREAKAVAALSHPNILSIFDFGTHDGVAYAVTELLEGETLRGKLDAGPISQRETVDYARQIARGLSAAHEKGIVHRDLKPENIFVTRDGHIEILDFGLAKRDAKILPGQETSAPTASGHTEPGTVMGSVGYMSPEQVRGLSVDHRSDIFSFGAVLYELLSGRRAFKKDTAADTMSAILKEEPPELSQSGRSVSISLDHVVKHCLEKDRDHRFQSARDIAFALSEASGSASGSAQTSHPQLKTPLAGRSKALIAVAVLISLSGGAVLLMKRPPRPETPAIKRIAVLPFENLGSREDDYFADGIADAVRGKLTALSGIQVIARGSSMPYKNTTKTPQQIAKELDVGYLLTATVRWQKGTGTNSRVEVSPELVEVAGTGAPVSKWQQPFDAALTDVFQVQSDMAGKVARELGVALGAREERRLEATPTKNLAAYDAYLRGEEVWRRPVTVGESSRGALAFFEQAVALDPGFAQAWARISQESSVRYPREGHTPELAERARAAADKAVALAPDRPEGYLALGFYQVLVARDLRSALEQFVRGERLAPGNAELATAAAYAEMILGRWDAAVEHVRRAERLDPRSTDNQIALSDALRNMRRFREAREACDRGLAFEPGNLGLIQEKALTFLGEGDLPGARSVLTSAPREIKPATLVATVAVTLDMVWALDQQQIGLLLSLTPSAFDDLRDQWGICLAQAYALKGDTANVHVYADEARKAFEEQLRGMPDNAEKHAQLGLALAYLGQKEEAIREGQRGVALQPVAKDALNGPYIQHQLARIYILVGEPEKALDQLEPLLKIPYYVSPGWLKIDPNFDPLRSNPRFEKLVASAR